MERIILTSRFFCVQIGHALFTVVTALAVNVGLVLSPHKAAHGLSNHSALVLQVVVFSFVVIYLSLLVEVD
jgi:hypothetical protein